MRKALTVLAAAAAIAIATVATPSSADAQWRWRAPAFFGGLAAGAIIGSALATPYWGYGYYYPYDSYTYYGGPYGYYGGGYAHMSYYGDYTGHYGGYYGDYYGRPYYAGSNPCRRKAWNGYRWVHYHAC